MSRYHDDTGAILSLKYFKNDFKIFFKKYVLVVIVLYISRISLCVTSPLELYVRA